MTDARYCDVEGCSRLARHTVEFGDRENMSVCEDDYVSYMIRGQQYE